MDPTWQYQNNPVPWNQRFKYKGSGKKGTPLSLFANESPIKCGPEAIYHNVYKIQCDLRNNQTARTLQNTNTPEQVSEVLYYSPNKNDERFTTELSEAVNEICPKPNADKEESKVPLWISDFSVLWKDLEPSSFLPSPKQDRTELLNAIVRFSVILFGALALITMCPNQLIYIPIVMISTIIVNVILQSMDDIDSITEQVKNCQVSRPTIPSLPDINMVTDMGGEEAFTPPPNGRVIGGIGTTSNPETDFQVTNGPAEFDNRLFKGTSENMGDLIAERNEVLSYDPFCPLSMEGGGREFILTGNTIKRHMFY